MPDEEKSGMRTPVGPLLEVSNLRTWFYMSEGVLKAIDGVSLSLCRGKILGMIGESGCGKSVLAQSILRIVPRPGRIVNGQILFRGQDGETSDLTRLRQFGRRMRGYRGREISMIFQEPMTSLSPVHTIGSQIEEAILLHRTKNRREAREISLGMLGSVGVPNPIVRAKDYPHHLSGGLRQRAMIAMALSCNPSLLIADEPTTALDVTVQAQILELLKTLQEKNGMSMLYITHDLGVICEIAHEVMVMYLGFNVESASTQDLFHNPAHPYTRLLMKSIPRFGKKMKKRLDVIRGTVPIPINLPPECPFLRRCPESLEGTCDAGIPPMIEITKHHWVRCFLYKAS
jgi:oligopeptide/dipeptide ABC transporter ATP-binding protein